jgi:hypothetical protein
VDGNTDTEGKEADKTDEPLNSDVVVVLNPIDRT